MSDRSTNEDKWQKGVQRSVPKSVEKLLIAYQLYGFSYRRHLLPRFLPHISDLMERLSNPRWCWPRLGLRCCVFLLQKDLGRCVLFLSGLRCLRLPNQRRFKGLEHHDEWCRYQTDQRGSPNTRLTTRDHMTFEFQIPTS